MSIHIIDLLGPSRVGECTYCGVRVVADCQPWTAAAEEAWVDPTSPDSPLRAGWESATVDHVVPKGQGGTDDLSNCVLACWPCNHAKGSRTPAQWGVVP